MHVNIERRPIKVEFIIAKEPYIAKFTPINKKKELNTGLKLKVGESVNQNTIKLKNTIEIPLGEGHRFKSH